MILPAVVSVGTLAVLVTWAGCGNGESTAGCSSDSDCSDGETCFRSQCLPACDDDDGCDAGRACQDGACVPSSANGCTTASDCTTPTSLCQSADGAVCADGRCEYAERVCDEPPAPSCSPDGSQLTRSVLPGTCSEEDGCTYVEEVVDVDPVNCEAIARGDCDAVQCLDTTCRSDGVAEVNSQTGLCECVFRTLTPAPQDCDDGNPCTEESGCDGLGECVALPEQTVANGGACVDSEQNVIEALDEQGNPRELNDGEVAPTPFCFEGQCVECTTENSAERCDDQNACTADTCSERGLCENTTEPLEGAQCELPESAPIFGDLGFCLGGECAQCDSRIQDEQARDAACVQLGSNGQPDLCLPATCDANTCIYDLEGARGVRCDPAGGAGDDYCFEGECVECFEDGQCSDGDTNACTSARCVNNSCQDVPDDGNECDNGRDGDGDECVNATCIDCTPGSTDVTEIPEADLACNDIEALATEDGAECVIRAKPGSGLACSDGDACTPNDVCVLVNGTERAECEPGAKINCSDASTGDDSCRTGACDPSTGQCVLKPNGTGCDDGKVCTRDDICTNGSCDGISFTCPDGGSCREAPCDGTKCLDIRDLPNGTTCERCGVCSGGTCNRPDCCDNTECPNGEPCIGGTCGFGD
ncbi:MAG: hypothetical protein AAF219_10130 [Myxococcota bacterium]